MNSHEIDGKQLGGRIRELRRRMHLTQAELAGRVGIRPGPMNYLEKGHHLPSLPVITKVARELGVTIDQLLHKTPLPYVGHEGKSYGAVCSEDIWMAESRSFDAERSAMVRFDPHKLPLPLATRQKIEDIIRVFMALEDICAVPKQASIPLDIRLPAHEKYLGQFVDKIRTLFGVSHAVIFDYIELFENAGLRVVFLGLPPQIKSLSCYDRVNQNVFLFVRDEATVEHQLFRLCYELGRIYLYNGHWQPGRGRKLDAEHAARRFSALFLMPEEAVATTVQQLGIAPNQWNWEMLMRIKHRFGVSAETFLYRLEELRLIARQNRDALKAEIYTFYEQHGYSEPDSSRRILTPNGRLGDLLLSAAIKWPAHCELPGIRATLKEHRINMP